MANILLLGNAECLVPMGAALAAHVLFVHADEHQVLPDGISAHPVSSIEDLPDALDAIFELSVSCGDRLYNLYRAQDFAERGAPALFVNALTTTATDAATGQRPDCPVVGISYIPALFAETSRIEAAAALQTDPEAVPAAIALLRELTGKDVELVQDRVGLVSARVLAMIVNEAAFAVLEGIATPADIDMAMKLGANHPDGPLHWCDRIGTLTILSILEALHDEYGEERYRPCVLLKQYARAARTFTEG